MKRKTLRRKRRARKTRKGGVELGKGGFGKVYAPGMLCKGMPAEVTKVFSTNDRFTRKAAENTIQKLKDISAELQKIDRNQDYFLYPTFCEERPTLSQENLTDGLTDNDIDISYNMKRGVMTVEQKYKKEIEKANDVAQNPTPPSIMAVKTTFMPVFKKVKELADKLHSVNILHNDISPGNVIVMEDGSYRLIDFDLSWKGELLPSNKRGDITFFIDKCLDGWDILLPSQRASVVSEVLKT